MTGVQSLWNKIWRKVLAPEVDPGTLDDRLRAVKSALPPPVIWLLGKAQSGKTSLVHAMTGSSRAEIGGGFRPCTRTAQMYSFPNEDECFLRFLDTRGLGEAGQDGSAEIPKLEAEADLIVVVVKAMDHAQQHVLDILRGVAARHPDWPILVLQTALHEGYPTGAMRHAVPYPYAEPPYPPAVPHDLARSLLAQRELFRGYRAALRAGRFHAAGRRLRAGRLWPGATLVGDRGAASAGTARHVGPDAGGPPGDPRRTVPQGPAAYRRPMPWRPAGRGRCRCRWSTCRWSWRPRPGCSTRSPRSTSSRWICTRMAEIAGALGFGFLTRLGVRELVKLVPVPGLGESVSALYAAASTYALGVALCQYFSRVRGGAKLDVDIIRRLYATELKQSKLWIAERMRHQTPAKEPAS